MIIIDQLLCSNPVADGLTVPREGLPMTRFKIAASLLKAGPEYEWPTSTVNDTLLSQDILEKIALATNNIVPPLYASSTLCTMLPLLFVV